MLRTLCGLLQEDPIITEVERRIARVTQLPELNGEGLQILHYVDGQARRPALLLSCTRVCSLPCLAAIWEVCGHVGVLLSWQACKEGDAVCKLC